MTVELFTIRRAAVAEEPAVDPMGTVVSSGFVDIPMQKTSIELALNVNRIETEVVTQRKDKKWAPVIGRSRPTLTVTMPFYATGAAAGNATQSPDYDENALMLLLKICMGGAVRGTGSTATGASSAATPVAASGAGFQGGGALGWVDSTGRYNLHGIKEVSTNDIELHQVLPASPDSPSPLYGATTIYLTEKPATRAQLIVESAVSEDRWRLFGGQMLSAPTIEFARDGLPTITFAITFAGYATLTPQSITPATYPLYSPIYTEGLMRLLRSGTTSYLCPAEIGLALNGPIFGATPCPSAYGGVLGYTRLHAVPIALLDLALPLEDLSWFTRGNALEENRIEWQLGTSAPGEAILWQMPTARVLPAPTHLDQDSMLYHTVQMEADVDTATVNGSNADLRQSAMSFSFG